MQGHMSPAAGFVAPLLVFYTLIITTDAVYVRPVCQAPLPAVLNGMFPNSCANYVDGSVCTAVCRTGYTSIPVPTTTCVGGVWSSPSDVCNKVCIGMPTVTLIGGTWSPTCNSTRFNTYCPGVCDNGWTGSPQVYCGNGWDTKVQGRCTLGAVSCLSKPSTVLNGIWPDSCMGSAVGDVCEAVCNMNRWYWYNRTGTPRVTCLSVGSWSTPTNPSFCEQGPALGCLGNPAAVANTIFACGPVLAGMVCKGDCSTGYRGSPNATCQANSTYAGVVGACTLITCSGNPTASPNNASFSCASPALPGTVCKGTCNTGYSGAPAATCLADGTYGAATGACIDVDACTWNPCTVGVSDGHATCYDLPAPALNNTDGRMCNCSAPGYSYTEAGGCQDVEACTWNPCTVGVSDGHATCYDRPPPALNNTDGRVCNCSAPGYSYTEAGGCQDADGCAAVSCIMDHSNGTCNDEPAPSTGYSCTCVDGYIWSNVTSNCTIPCPGAPPALANNTWPNNCTDGLLQASCTGTCDAGFINPPSVVCDATAGWVSSGKCAPANCTTLPAGVPHATWSSNCVDAPVGAGCSATCDSYFLQSGPINSTCNAVAGGASWAPAPAEVYCGVVNSQAFVEVDVTAQSGAMWCEAINVTLPAADAVRASVQAFMNGQAGVSELSLDVTCLDSNSFGGAVALSAPISSKPSGTGRTNSPGRAKIPGRTNSSGRAHRSGNTKGSGRAQGSGRRRLMDTLQASNSVRFAVVVMYYGQGAAAQALVNAATTDLAQVGDMIANVMEASSNQLLVLKAGTGEWTSGGSLQGGPRNPDQESRLFLMRSGDRPNIQSNTQFLLAAVYTGTTVISKAGVDLTGPTMDPAGSVTCVAAGTAPTTDASGVALWACTSGSAGQPVTMTVASGSDLGTVAFTIGTDCVGSFGSYTACDNVCGAGNMTRTFAVTTPAANGGRACDWADGYVDIKPCTGPVTCTECNVCATTACAPVAAGTDCSNLGQCYNGLCQPTVQQYEVKDITGNLEQGLGYPTNNSQWVWNRLRQSGIASGSFVDLAGESGMITPATVTSAIVSTAPTDPRTGSGPITSALRMINPTINDRTEPTIWYVNNSLDHPVGLFNGMKFKDFINSNGAFTFSWYRGSWAGMGVGAAPSFRFTVLNPALLPAAAAGGSKSRIEFVWEPTYNPPSCADLGRPNGCDNVQTNTWVTSTVSLHQGAVWAYMGAYTSPIKQVDCYYTLDWWMNRASQCAMCTTVACSSKQLDYLPWFTHGAAWFGTDDIFRDGIIFEMRISALNPKTLIYANNIKITTDNGQQFTYVFTTVTG